MLDDFHSIQLDKMGRYVCLKESGITIGEGNDESSSGSDESGDSGDSEDGVDNGESTVVGSDISKEDYEALEFEKAGTIFEEDEEEEEQVVSVVDVSFP